jgi:hypothetical protein
VRESTWLAVSGALIAGALHLLVIPTHGGVGNAHGLVFLALGLAQLGWAGLWLVERTRGAWLAGLALSAGSIVLYAVTRVVRAPFSLGPEEVDAPGLVATLAEATLLAGLLLHEREAGRAVRPALPWVAGALALGLVAYAGGLAAEPAFPQLGEHGSALAPAPEGSLTLTEEHEHESVDLTFEPEPRAGTVVNVTAQLSVHGSDDTRVAAVNMSFALGGANRTVAAQPWTASSWRAQVAFDRAGNWTVLVFVDRTWTEPTAVPFDVPVAA